jgi:hypothetical protein
MFGRLFGWGASADFWPAIIYSAMFGWGIYLLYRMRGPMLAFLSSALAHDQSITVHAFIARRHGDDARVRLLAAALTTFAFTGLATAEAIGVASLLKPILPGGAGSAYLLAGGLLALMALYTIPAGNSGVMRSAQAQLGLLYLGLFGSTLLLLYLLMSSIGRMPAHGTFAVAVVAVCCAIMLSYRRSRYVDTSPIGRAATDKADDAGREPLGARLFRRSVKVINVLISVVAATALVFALMELYSEGVPAIVAHSIAALDMRTPVSPLGLTALALLALFYPLVDMTNWQRIAAIETDPNAARGEPDPSPATLARILRMYAGESALVWLLMCMFGAIAALATATRGGADAMNSFVAQLASQQNSVADSALWLLLLSIMAIALSTMSSMFSASLSAIRYDIAPSIWPKLASPASQPADQATATRRAVMVGCGLCAVMIVVWVVGDANLEITFASGKFWAILMAFYCAQLSFVPLVLGPMIGRTREASATVSPGWALAVLAVGAAAGATAAIVYLATGYEPWLWASIPACLGSGLLVLVIARLWPGKSPRTA